MGSKGKKKAEIGLVCKILHTILVCKILHTTNNAPSK